MEGSGDGVDARQLDGAGLTLLAGELLSADQTVLAVVLGVVAAVALMAALLAFQRWRYGIFDGISHAETDRSRPGAMTVQV